MLDLTGPGIHFTHYVVCSANEAARMLIRLLLMRVWSPEDWYRLWISRNVATCGLLRSVAWALRELDINWDAPFRWSRGGRQLDLSVPQLLDRAGRESFRKHMRGHEIQGKLHDTREFLRFVVASRQAARLPYLYAGLEDGWMEDSKIRRSTHSLRQLCAGPALLSGAIWTELDESRRNGRSSGMLQVQSRGGDTHALSWRCPVNLPMLKWLGSNWVLNVLTLRHCLRACADVD